MLAFSKCVSMSTKTRPKLRVVVNKVLKHTKVKKVVKAEDKNKYSSTVNLPQTDFQLWLKGSKRIEEDERILKDCGFAELYNWQRNNVKGPEFILHDGPPYANGIPHMGHAINKILKDVTVRWRLLKGHRVHYRPGWDCHGLPIELKAMAGQDVTNLTPLSVRQKDPYTPARELEFIAGIFAWKDRGGNWCFHTDAATRREMGASTPLHTRKFAKEAIRDQKAVFRSWGVMADWDCGCYHTFDKSYVKNQLLQFYTLYEQGMVYRDVKPVYWSPSSRTALAESELEYNEKHVSRTVHVGARVCGRPGVLALVWTTTPWTVPANEAIAFGPSLAYSLVRFRGVGEGEARYIVATDLAEELASQLGTKIDSVESFDASELAHLRYEHPLHKGRTCPFVAADHVTAEKGTGLVHTAPSHGPDDFKLGKKHNLPVPCLVDESGHFSEEAGADLAGLPVLKEGTERVVELCRSRGVLVKTGELSHSYPYDWRTNLPVIVRASRQWFFDTTRVKDQALAALREVRVLPERGASGLASQVQTRPFWCISRQRAWGVPVPALYANDKPVITKELIEHYCQLLDSKGDDFWWSCSKEELAPLSLLKGLELDVKPSDLEVGKDILDIWLDSGLSWSAVLESGSADVYLEGIDQCNGWFQSSLLTSIALQRAPPYKTVFVHGFAVDEKGMKMSKSVGNVVNPQDIVYGGPDYRRRPTYGVDVLRWWVSAHATHQSSVPVGPATLADSQTTVQKMRSVMRFLLGAINGLPRPSPPPPLTRQLDLYMLHTLHAFENQVVELYDNFQYNRVCSALSHFVSNQVSALYCHLTKDRLYCEREDCEERRAAQLVMHHTLNTIVYLVGPVLPVLAEEVHLHQPNKETSLLFQRLGRVTRPEWARPQSEAVIQLALDIKQQVAKLTPLNCNNWEMAATITAADEQYQTLKVLQWEGETSESELAEILQVSRVTLRSGEANVPLRVEVTVAHTHHCQRCRRHTALEPDILCPRCQTVVSSPLSS